ncbi:DUF397 domain-containing protein [Sphaerisporangium sp. NPDC088356]|uniref:DUF397 domain-containing protein n=1 Tax=Sphaerisporangium sp. NPDC088356 TaxID=3154871 RepID=UPI0034290B4C
MASSTIWGGSDNARSPFTVIWCKSSDSGQENCVEVAVLSTGNRVVRDSKNLAGPRLRLAPGERHAFVGGVKAGRFAGP